MATKILNSDNFHDTITAQPGLALVDCFAEWCPPCKMLAPILEELSAEMTDVAFFKVDIDESPAIASQYAVSSIPTLLLFRDGKLENRSLGFKSKNALKKFLS